MLLRVWLAWLLLSCLSRRRQQKNEWAIVARLPSLSSNGTTAGVLEHANLNQKREKLQNEKQSCAGIATNLARLLYLKSDDGGNRQQQTATHTERGKCSHHDDVWL